MTQGFRSKMSARVEPFWLNPATIKGTIAIAAGVLLLAAPNLSALLLRLSVGIALLVGGTSDIWFGIRRKTPRRLRSILEGVLSLGFGALVIVLPTETVRGISILGAVYLVVRGLAAIVSAFNLRRTGQPWGVHVVRGLLYLTVAALLLVLPDSFVELTIGAIAAAAVIVGGIMLSFGIRERSDNELIDLDVASVTELINDWLQERDLGGKQRDEIGEGFFFEPPERTAKLASWWVMLLLSVAIATFGIIQDSTAVVIGAMLIAPLMVPILGVGAGIVNAWRTRVVASTALVFAGAGSAIALAFILGQWLPIIVPLAENSQVTSRVAPNLIDMLIALAAGSAGAYANVNDRVSDSIAGVAIAVALVPPLGVVGLTLQAGMFDDAWGALLLFLTNLVSIILAASVVFFLTGYAPITNLKENRAEVFAWLRTVTLAALLILIPLVLTAQNVLTDTANQRIATEDVAEWLDGTSLTAISIDVTGSQVDIFTTGPEDVPSLTELENSLEEGFGEPVQIRVEHARTQVVTSNEADS